MNQVTIYGKPGCCLCDEARTVVRAVRALRPFELHEVDVSIDPALNARLGERIPVVAVNGDEAFEFHVDAGALEERLDKVGA